VKNVFQIDKVYLVKIQIESNMQKWAHMAHHPRLIFPSFLSPEQKPCSCSAPANDLPAVQTVKLVENPPKPSPRAPQLDLDWIFLNLKKCDGIASARFFLSRQTL
jgi:hypothetical protein